MRDKRHRSARVRWKAEEGTGIELRIMREKRHRSARVRWKAEEGTGD